MNELINQFGIQIHVLLGQMLLFGILFFVFRKYVYSPVLKILDERRSKIEKSLEQAKELDQRTQKLQEEIEAKMQEAKKQGDTLIAQSKEVGEQARNEILIRANKEVSQLLEKARTDIERQKEEMLAEIRDYIVKTSLVVVGKVLEDKLDEKTREKFVVDSLEELHGK